MRNALTAAVLTFSFIGVFWPVVALAEEGMAVYYSDVFQGRPTASKEIFDQEGMTAAHKTRPFGSRVQVTNLENGKSVILTINDRMARRNSNIIDVTRRAAQELGFQEQGVTRVSIEPAP